MMQAERLLSFPLAMGFGSHGPFAVRQDRMRCKDVLVAVAHRHIRILSRAGTALSLLMAHVRRQWLSSRRDFYVSN
jgi:hypothetical protein